MNFVRDDSSLSLNETGELINSKCPITNDYGEDYEILIQMNETDYLAKSVDGNLFLVTLEVEIDGYPDCHMTLDLKYSVTSVIPIKREDLIIGYAHTSEGWMNIHPEPDKNLYDLFNSKPKKIKGDEITGDLIDYGDEYIRTNQGCWSIDWDSATKINMTKSARNTA